MKYFLNLFISVVFFSCSIFAKQEKYVKHTVITGETIQQIALKYKVTPFDIYKLNPDSKNGIQPNTILLIPPSTVSSTTVTTVKSPVKITEITHEVLPKETLYSISKQYDISIEGLKEVNEELMNSDIKIGQIIRIPNKKNIVISKEKNPVLPKKESVVYHEIEPKETKFSIVKKYGISIEQLEKNNPIIVTSFPIGYKLIIFGNEPIKIDKPNPEIKKETVSTKINFQDYIVKPKETFYSISTQFNISEIELVKYNPELKDGVKAGMSIKIPIIKPDVNIVKVKSDLTKSLITDVKKELVLLLPFNLSKIEKDSLNTTSERLKKDKFLNMTLDFYSGALMAIDSAKVIGLNVNVKIYDSQETKNTSNVLNIASENNLKNAHAIIGPFYQSNVESLARMLEKDSVAVISPLSKETETKVSNIYQSLPTNDEMRDVMFKYMHKKNGNIIAIIDPKKNSVKQYLQENKKGVKILGLTERSSVVTDSLRPLLLKDKINFVIVASEKTGMILSATNAMISLMNDYKIQMVILEPNETLDFEEISLNRLTKLNLLYPSITRPNSSIEEIQFENKYKKQNNVFPNQYATRGFDITFDTLLRLSQGKSFEETTLSTITEQIENKFNYFSERKTDGFVNKGVYVLYYDTDLTVKEAQ